MGKFRDFFEATDIFGFDSIPVSDVEYQPIDNLPLRFFNLEYLMEILKSKRINSYDANDKFINEIQWGNRLGSVKLEVDTGFTFFIKKLAFDLEGNPRWIGKKVLQLNRKGLGGYEESVAAEILGALKGCIKEQVESPIKDYDKLERLVEKMGTTMRRVAQEKFLFKKIKKQSNHSRS